MWDWEHSSAIIWGALVIGALAVLAPLGFNPFR